MTSRTIAHRPRPLSGLGRALAFAGVLGTGLAPAARADVTPRPTAPAPAVSARHVALDRAAVAAKRTQPVAAAAHAPRETRRAADTFLRPSPAVNDSGVDDTLLLHSSGFDALSGGCDPRSWRTADLSTRVFAHVSDRYKVNRDFFSFTRATNPPLPSPIAGTPIETPAQVASNDSGMVVYAEALDGTDARIVALYPQQDLARHYADVPIFPGIQDDTPFEMAFDEATGDLIVGSRYANNAHGGGLYRIPKGGGAATLICGGGSTVLDGAATNAVITVPEGITTDAAGNIYFVEVNDYPYANHVRMVRASDHQLVTVAGPVFYGGQDTGDGGPASAANLALPRGLALNAAEDTLYVLDGLSQRIRTISLVTGIIDALPGAQQADFIGTSLGFSTPWTLTRSGNALYAGTLDGTILRWSGGALTPVAGGGSSIVSPEQASLGTSLNFLGTINDMCPAPEGGIVFRDGRALLYRLDDTGHVSVYAGKSTPLQMGHRALWFGADSTSAPDEVANWVRPVGYGNGWSQRLTSPAFSYSAHPAAKLTFDFSIDMYAYQLFVHQAGDEPFIAVRGQQPDGSWLELPMRVTTDVFPDAVSYTYPRIAGTVILQAQVDLTGQTLAASTRLQVLVESSRFGSDEDGFGPGGASGVIVDNLRLADAGGDVLPPVDFEDGGTGGWTLSAVNAPYVSPDFDELFVRDTPPPQTQVVLRTDFDFSDRTCAWTFLSPGDSIPNGTYASLTSPWLALADKNGSAYISFSGKLATDNQRRFVQVFVRGKNAGATHASSLMFSSLLSSGTEGSDLSAPHVDQFTLAYPGDFQFGTEGSAPAADSIQIVFQVQDRLEEFANLFPQPRGASHLPYLDDLRVFQRSGDDDHDGVPNALDACRAVSSTGQDADGDGCPDATATLRHVESWPAASGPIHVRLSQHGDPAIHDGSDKAAIRAAIASWMAVPGADVRIVVDADTPQTDAAALDGVNLITFEDDLQFSPDVLAITPTTSFTRRGAFDDQLVPPGQIVDSDLIFNRAARFGTPSSPVTGGVDLQSVATHELGHLLGLSHSGAADATMYPVLQEAVGAATLADDDRAAIAAAYPANDFDTRFGTITGHVVRGTSGGAPIPGALVTAWRLDAAQNPTHVAASDYSDAQGAFALRGLDGAGPYGVRIDPLDGTIPGLIPAAINDRVMAMAQTNFSGEWWDAVEDGMEDPGMRTPVAVPAGTVQELELVSPRDVVPPAVASILPADLATGVGIDGRVLVNFSEAVEAGTVGSSFALRVTGQSGRLGGSGNLLTTGRTFVFTPDFPLQFDTDYEIEIGTALTDRQGNPLAAPYVTHFHTMPAPAVAIFDVIPRNAPPGALITIRGQGFGGSVVLALPVDGGTQHLLAAASNDAIIAALPPNAVSGPIVATVDGVDSNPFDYTVTTPGDEVPVPDGAAVVLPFAPSDVVVAPEGASAFAVGPQGFASIDLSPTRPLFRVADVEPIPGGTQLALSVDGLRAYIVRPEFQDLVEVVTDTTSSGFGHVYRSLPLPGRPGGICMAPDGAVAYVPEENGSHVYAVDVNPASPTFRAVLRELKLPGVQLAGGVTIGTYTSTASPRRWSPTARSHAAGSATSAAPRRFSASAAPPHRPDAGAPYTSLFLNSRDAGLLVFDLTSDSSFAAIEHTPSAGRMVTSIDGNAVYTPGDGVHANAIVSGCLTGCDGVRPVIVGGEVRGLAISPDNGALLAANSVFGELQVLRDNGTTVAGQVPAGRSPVAVATSADGGVTAVANSGDRSIGFYRPSSGAAIVSPLAGVASPGDEIAVRVGLDAVTHVDFGSASATVQSTRGDGVACVVPQALQATVPMSAASADDRSPSLPFRIVDRQPGFAIHETGTAVTLPNTGAPVHGTLVVPSPDGRMLAAAYYGLSADMALLRVGDGGPDGPTFENLLHITPDLADPIRSGAFTPDGRELWYAAEDHGVRRVDTDPASPGFGSQGVLGSLVNTVHAIAADPLAPAMAVGGEGVKSLMFYDYARNSPTFADLDPVTALTYAPDGHVVVAGGQGRVWFVQPPPAAPDPVASPAHGSSPAAAVAVTADGHRAVGVFEDGGLGVWSLESADEWTELYYGALPGGAHGFAMVPAPDGHSVIVSCSDGALLVIDASTAPPVIRSGGPSNVRGLARTADGRHVYASVEQAGASDELRLVATNNASALSAVSGDAQTALVGATLPVPVVVRAADAGGHPLAGALVRFTASAGSLGAGFGLVRSRYTDTDGLASVTWTMPASPGAPTLTAVLAGLPASALTLTATAQGDPQAVAPALVALGPPDGARGIAAGGEVFARFNHAMGAPDQVAPYLALRIGDDVVPGTLRADEGGRTLFFQPQQPLPYGATARFVVAAGAPDAFGNSLAVADSASFTVQSEPVLAIATVAPPAGRSGAAVTLNGAGFSPVATLNTVTFGGVIAPVLTASGTSLVMRVPAGAPTGPIVVHVAAQASNGVPFVVLPDSAGPRATVDSLPAPRNPLNLVVTPDGRRAYVVSPRENAVGALDVFHARQLALIQVGANPHGIAMLPDGSRAYVANYDGDDVTIIGTAPEAPGTYNRAIATIAVGRHPSGVAVIGGGPRVIVLNEGDSTASVIDATRGAATFDQVVKSVPLPSSGNNIIVSPDGSRAFISTGAGVTIVDLQSYVTASVPLPSGGKNITITPDGGLLFVLTNDDHIVVIDVNPGSSTPNRVVASVPVPSGGKNVTISPDGGLLFITLTDSGTLLVIEIRTSAGGGTGGSSTAPGPAVTLVTRDSIPVGRSPAGVAVDPFSTYVLVANQGSDDVTLIQTSSAAPAIQVLFPNGGETLVPGQVATLLWDTQGLTSGQHVTLRLTRDLGQTYETLATDVPNSGTYDWTVTGPQTTDGKQALFTARLQVLATNAFGNTGADSSDRPFTIFDAVTGTLLETFRADAAPGGVHLTWRFAANAGVAAVAVERAASDQGPWTRIDAPITTASDGSRLSDTSARPGNTYWYWLVARVGGHDASFAPVQVALPALEFALAAIAPNPSHGDVTIAYSVARESHVRLALYDVAGREVARLADGMRAPGTYQARWSAAAHGGRAVAGLYFVRYEGGGKTFVRRLVLAR